MFCALASACSRSTRPVLMAWLIVENSVAREIAQVDDHLDRLEIAGEIVAQGQERLLALPEQGLVREDGRVEPAASDLPLKGRDILGELPLASSTVMVPSLARRLLGRQAARDPHEEVMAVIAFGQEHASGGEPVAIGGKDTLNPA